MTNSIPESAGQLNGSKVFYDGALQGRMGTISQLADPSRNSAPTKSTGSSACSVAANSHRKTATTFDSPHHSEQEL